MNKFTQLLRRNFLSMWLANGLSITLSVLGVMIIEALFHQIPGLLPSLQNDADPTVKQIITSTGLYMITVLPFIAFNQAGMTAMSTEVVIKGKTKIRTFFKRAFAKYIPFLFLNLLYMGLLLVMTIILLTFSRSLFSGTSFIVFSSTLWLPIILVMLAQLFTPFYLYVDRFNVLNAFVAGIKTFLFHIRETMWTVIYIMPMIVIIAIMFIGNHFWEINALDIIFLIISSILMQIMNFIICMSYFEFFHTKKVNHKS